MEDECEIAISQKHSAEMKRGIQTNKQHQEFPRQSFGSHAKLIQEKFL